MTRCLRAAGFFPLLHGCPNATPGKLPKTVIPVHDAIELTPDLESLALAGVEVVDIEVREPSPFAVDTALGLDLTSVLFPVWQAAVAVRLAVAPRAWLPK